MQGLDPAESRHLLLLCKSGRLYEVEKWVALGKSTQCSASFKETPIEVALCSGFHSLAELLLRHESQQSAKNDALRIAVSLRRLDLVELAFSYGAEVNSVPFADVLLEYNPDVIRLFIKNGADPTRDQPFAEAFREKVRTALGPFLECKERDPLLVDKLQEQADSALRYFCSKGDAKWISLMLWLGANPRSRGPNLSYFQDKDDPESHTTALEEACEHGDLAFVKKLKPDPERDNLEELLLRAAWKPSQEVISFLLNLGAQPNNALSGNSRALCRCMWNLPWQDLDSRLRGLRASKWRLRESMSAIKELESRGACWVPCDKEAITSVRRQLLKCDADVTVELISLFRDHHACSPEVTRALVSTPAMKAHLKGYERHAGRLGLTDVLPPPGALKVKDARSKPSAPFPKYVAPTLMAKYSREKLYEEVWSSPVQIVAKQYGVSGVALAKTCKKLAIPVPGRGYWAKRIAGRQYEKRPPLPFLVKEE